MTLSRARVVPAVFVLLVACGDDSGVSSETDASVPSSTGSMPDDDDDADDDDDDDADDDDDDDDDDVTTGGPGDTTGGPEDTTGEPADSSSGGEDPLTYAGDMHGYRWELPCEDPELTDTCPWDPALLEGAIDDPENTLHREDLVVFGGDPEVIYDVEIQIRGLTEPKDFSGGMVLEDHFQIGGDPGNNDYNIYAIDVADPGQRYTLNRNEMGTGHYTFVLDYTVTIPIRGGSEVRLTMIDPNNVAIANPGGASGQMEPFVVPDVEPFPEPFFGQFIQMDVLSVVESGG